MATELLDLAAAQGAEQIAIYADEHTGLRAIVAIHSTVLGPALGGTRFYPFASEREALLDVLRLAQGMTYKHAACGNDLGGGKAVIVGDPRPIRSDALMLAYGRFIDRLGGRYLTAEDVGTTQADMDLLRTVTPFVTGVERALGGSGDPSRPRRGACSTPCTPSPSGCGDRRHSSGRHVAIAGVGKVGRALAEHLARRGRPAHRGRRARRCRSAAAPDDFGARSPRVDTVHAVECDIFSPCALGRGAERADHPANCGARRCAGAANNQLADEADGERIAARGVLYAPDYVVNAGGVINIADEAGAGGYDRAAPSGASPPSTTRCDRCSRLADERGSPPAAAADRLAEQRLDGSRLRLTPRRRSRGRARSPAAGRRCHRPRPSLRAVPPRSTTASSEHGLGPAARTAAAASSIDTPLVTAPR